MTASRESESVPSVTRMVTVDVNGAPNTGVQLSTPEGDMLAPGGRPVAEKVSVSLVSTSVAENWSINATDSSAVMSDDGEVALITGASLTGVMLMVTWAGVEAAVPSEAE